MIKFTVYGDPKAQKRHRDSKPITVNGRTFSPKYDPSIKDKNVLLSQAIEHRPEQPIDYPVKLVIKACFARPGEHFGKRNGVPYLKDTSPLWHSKRPDGDNIAKLVLDALNGIFWKDDSVVSVLVVEKQYIVNSSPRMEIEITRL